MKLRNEIQLIAYPDSLGGNLEALHQALREHFEGVIGGVHILPFYPSTSDRGFSPTTHLEVDSNFGDWKDVERIGESVDLMADLVVNHVSCQSEYFRDYLTKGDASEYKDFFIDEEKFFAGAQPNEDDIAALYRPRPESPFREHTFGDGTKKKLFSTFSIDQIDLDTENPEVLSLLASYIDQLADAGVDLLRLDALGYARKRRGTNSFMIPETYEFIQWLAEKAHARGVAILPEIHAHYTEQQKLAAADGVDYVYDFGLPMLVLFTIFFGDTRPLERWMEIRPANAITVLDTHDGIGVVDANGLLTDEEIDRTLHLLRVHGGNAMLRATGTNSDNVDIYQMNVTYYSALGRSAEGYLLARAIQFFAPGIPQVYYVGALAGKNDEEKLNATGVGRDINRHDYTLEEIARECERDVVRWLFALMRFRNTYPAFGGEFSIIPCDAKRLHWKWKKENLSCELIADLEVYDARIVYIDEETGEKKEMKLCESIEEEMPKESG